MSIRPISPKQGRKTYLHKRWVILARMAFPLGHDLTGQAPFGKRPGAPGRAGVCILSQPSTAAPTTLTKPGLPAPVELTTREKEVLRLVSQGLTNAQIARLLVISVHTVNAHVRSISTSWKSTHAVQPPAPALNSSSSEPSGAVAVEFLGYLSIVRHGYQSLVASLIERDGRRFLQGGYERCLLEDGFA